MASFAFTNAKALLAQGQIALQSVPIRVAILMTNNNAETAGIEDVTTVSGITLDEYNGANYVRKALTGQAVTVDNTNNLAAFSHANVIWNNLGAGVRQAKALLYFQFVTSDADSIPIAYVLFNPAWQGNGGTVTYGPAAAGAIQIT